MQTTKLQQEFIKDEYEDVVRLASKLIGTNCCNTIMEGNPKKGDGGRAKYQITPNIHLIKEDSQKINITAFNNYFYDNFGKWKDCCYFDTPSQAFFALIKAWAIWNDDLQNNIKLKYTKPVEKIFNELS